MIERFRGEYSWLSNFAYFEKPKKFSLDVELPTVIFTTSEHMYQSFKFEDYDIRFDVSKHPSKGLKVFIRSHKEKVKKIGIKLR